MLLLSCVYLEIFTLKSKIKVIIEMKILERKESDMMMIKPSPSLCVIIPNGVIFHFIEISIL